MVLRLFEYHVGGWCDITTVSIRVFVRANYATTLREPNIDDPSRLADRSPISFLQLISLLISQLSPPPLPGHPPVCPSKLTSLSIQAALKAPIPISAALCFRLNILGLLSISTDLKRALTNPLSHRITTLNEIKVLNQVCTCLKGEHCIMVMLA